jgi:hypothetical protein
VILLEEGLEVNLLDRNPEEDCLLDSKELKTLNFDVEKWFIFSEHAIRKNANEINDFWQRLQKCSCLNGASWSKNYT